MATASDQLPDDVDALKAALTKARAKLSGAAAVFFYSADRAAIHPERHLAGYSGILQADAYAGFNTIYKPDRKPGLITEAACWAHGRRKFFELADIAAKARDRKPTTISPMALEAVRKIDAIFMAERSINGLRADERLAARRQDIAPLVRELIDWMERTGQALASQRGRQSHGLHTEKDRRVHALPR